MNEEIVVRVCDRECADKLEAVLFSENSQTQSQVPPGLKAERGTTAAGSPGVWMGEEKVDPWTLSIKTVLQEKICTFTIKKW